MELTETGAYHPIFPLIPPSELKRQIRINKEGMRKDLSPIFESKGIFCPEMAFTGGVAAQLKSLEYEWTVADDGNLDYYGLANPYNKIYRQNGFCVFLRSRLWSDRFALDNNNWKHGKDFVDQLVDSLMNWIGRDDGYVIIALDGETFGHHQKKFNKKFLEEMFDALEQAQSEPENEIATAHLSDIFQMSGANIAENPKFLQVSQFIPPSSWSTSRKDIERKDYFAWWKSKGNEIQRLHWLLLNLVLDCVRNTEGNDELERDMDKAMYSCQFWWSNIWKFNKNDPNPGEIYKGVFNLRRILHKATKNDNNKEKLEQGEKILRQLVTEIEKNRHIFLGEF